MNKNIENTKKLESPPKIVKNMFSEHQIDAFLEL